MRQTLQRMDAMTQNLIDKRIVDVGIVKFVTRKRQDNTDGVGAPCDETAGAVVGYVANSLGG